MSVNEDTSAQAPHANWANTGSALDKAFTMQDYADAYERGEQLEAVAIWDAIAEANYDYLALREGSGYKPELPPIISSFMPKSGGTFLFNRMIRTLGYVEFYWGITKANSHTEVYPTPSAVEVYQRGGFFCHSHALPTPYFRMIMDRQKIDPIWVHLRDPAEACLAGYFHYQGQGQGEGVARDTRLAAMEEEKKYLAEHQGLSIGEWPVFFRRWVRFYAGWIKGWVRYAEKRPGAVIFTYFDELQDVNAMLARVFASRGHEYSAGGIDGVLPEDRRRQEGSHDWRDGLSAEDIASQMPYLDIWARALDLRAG